ncbi:MAG: NAD(P)-dependent oxidoreductase [Bacteroidota bacterium]
MKKKILVLATSFLDDLISHPKDEGKAKQMLADLKAEYSNEIEVAYRCDRNPEDKLTVEELENVAAVIADLEIYDRELLSKVGKKAGGSLELIARYGIGFVSVDIEAATEYGVMVTNAPGCNAMPTAEWTQATVMDVAGRRLSHYSTASRGKVKEGPSRLDVTNKTLGIIGTGTIGKNVAKLMSGYDVKILAYDLYPDNKWAEENKATYVSLEEIYTKSDIITIHASASEQLIGQKELDLMKETTILVNCARGILTDNRAIYKAVKEGKIWGYGLDEIWLEEDLPLDENLNIIVSSHVGSDTDSGKIGMQVMSTEAVVDFIQGKTPTYVVNKEVLNNL